MMATNVVNISQSEDSNTYWTMLKGLSDEIKRDLIVRLTASLSKKKSISRPAGWASRIAGRWQDSRSAEEMIDDIYSSRTHNREIDL
jgi:hypothetical protein